MAPQRAAKKSSATALSHTTTRQGQQQRTRSRVVEEVEVLDDIDEVNAMEVDGESSEEEEAEESPKTTDNSIEELMTRMVEDQRKRLAQRKKGVRKCYDTDRETVLKSINGLFDEHERQASSAHQEQLKRLLDLLARKVKLEKAMADKLKDLRESYNAHSLDLERVLKCKISTLK